MNLQEVLIQLRLEGSYADQCKQYAEMLDSGEVTLLADELKGDEVSKNKCCEWDRKKAFINEHKHGVSFEFISRLFEIPIPEGHFMFADRPDSGSYGENDRVIAKIGKDRYVVIKIDKSSSVTRLISAYVVTRKQFERELSQHLIRSSAKSFIPLYQVFKAEDGVVVKSKVGCDVTSWLKLYLSFLEGRIDKEDAWVTLVHGFGLSDDEASWFIKEWLADRNIDYLSHLMGNL